MNYKFSDWKDINTHPTTNVWQKQILDLDNHIICHVTILPSNTNCFITFVGSISIDAIEASDFFASTYYRFYEKKFSHDQVEDLKIYIDNFLNKVIKLRSFL